MLFSLSIQKVNIANNLFIIIIIFCTITCVFSLKKQFKKMLIMNLFLKIQYFKFMANFPWKKLF